MFLTLGIASGLTPITTPLSLEVKRGLFVSKQLRGSEVNDESILSKTIKAWIHHGSVGGICLSTAGA